MKRIGLLLSIVVLVASASCGQKVFVLPKPELSRTPTTSESEVAKSATPKGMKLQDSRRIDTQPVFVFAAYANEEQYKLELKVFVIDEDKVLKTYDSGELEGQMVGFNDEVQNNSWGKLVADGVFVLPVSIYMGGNDWTRAYNKFFTVVDGNLVEIPVECEPGTVAGAMIEDDGKLVVPVYDGRFQMFNDLYHAISPSRAYIFEYDATKKAFVDATPKHQTYVKKAIDENIKNANTKENISDPLIQASTMISLYIQAEAGGMTEQVMPEIKTIMEKFPKDATVVKTWEQIQDASKNGKPFASFAPWGDEIDYRWKPLDMKESK